MPDTLKNICIFTLHIGIYIYEKIFIVQKREREEGLCFFQEQVNKLWSINVYGNCCVVA